MLLVLTLILSATPGGEIAYVALAENGVRQVSVLNLETESSRVVGPGKGDGAPVWSPDGEWLAFTSQTQNGLGIYVVRADGSDGRLLPTTEPWNRDPAWAPDGSALAYSAGDGLASRIHVYEIATETEIVWGGEGPPMLKPAWFPTPEVVAGLLLTIFGEDAEQNPTIEGEAMGLLAIGLSGSGSSNEGEEPRPLSNVSTDIYIVTSHRSVPFPSAALPSSHGRYSEWAPVPDRKGRGIAFESDDGGDREIFLTTVKRGAQDKSNHRAADWNPVWDHDGKWIAFESFRGGRRGIYRVHRENPRVISVAAFESAAAWAPTWSPDDEWIAFVSDRESAGRLYAVELSSGDMQPLGTQDAFAPAWRPKR